MKKIIINTSAILLFVIAFLLTSYSMPGYEMFGTWIVIFLPIISLLITLCLTVFFKGNFEQRFLKGLPWGFILTETVFVFAYFFVTFLALWV